MIKDTVNAAGETRFKFYTYNTVGRDVVITVFAKDEAEAWAKFDHCYGNWRAVDQVIKG